MKKIVQNEVPFLQLTFLTIFVMYRLCLLTIQVISFQRIPRETLMQANVSLEVLRFYKHPFLEDEFLELRHTGK